MESLNKKQKIVIIFIAITVVSIVCYYIYAKEENTDLIVCEQNEQENIQEVENQETQEEFIIMVHVAGAVNKEGIVNLNKGARISDAIEKAGGLKENADLKYINLASILEDGVKVYIPSIGEITDIDTNEKESVEINNIDINNKVNSKKVNINTASQAELETLSGIGPSTALKIIEYRKENGKFSNIEQIKEVNGIGEGKFDKIKDDIEV